MQCAQVLPGSVPSPLSPWWVGAARFGAGTTRPPGLQAWKQGVALWGRLGVPSVGSPINADASTFGCFKVASQSRRLLGSDLFIQHLYNQAVLLLSVCGTRGSEHEPPPRERGGMSMPRASCGSCKRDTKKLLLWVLSRLISGGFGIPQNQGQTTPLAHAACGLFSIPRSSLGFWLCTCRSAPCTSLTELRW